MVGLKMGGWRRLEVVVAVLVLSLILFHNNATGLPLLEVPSYWAVDWSSDDSFNYLARSFNLPLNPGSMTPDQAVQMRDLVNSLTFEFRDSNFLCVSALMSGSMALSEGSRSSNHFIREVCCPVGIEPSAAGQLWLVFERPPLSGMTYRSVSPLLSILPDQIVLGLDPLALGMSQPGVLRSFIELQLDKISEVEFRQRQGRDQNHLVAQPSVSCL